MVDQGQHIIHKLKLAWTNRLAMVFILVAIALTVFVSAVIIKFLHAGWLWVPLVLILSGFVSYFLFFEKISSKDVSTYLDKSVPLAEESTSLFEKPEEDLNYFEKLQVNRIAKFVNTDIGLPPTIVKKTKLAIGALLGSVLLALLIYWVPTDLRRSKITEPGKKTGQK